jgi:hypothetical protein
VIPDSAAGGSGESMVERQSSTREWSPNVVYRYILEQ